MLGIKWNNFFDEIQFMIVKNFQVKISKKI